MDTLSLRNQFGYLNPLPSQLLIRNHSLPPKLHMHTIFATASCWNNKKKMEQTNQKAWDP